jgi:signal peptidase II
MIRLKYLVFTLLVFVFDQATKLWVINSLDLGGEKRIVPFFTLVHWQNRGGLWGFLSSASEGVTFWIFLILPLLGLAFLIYFFWTTKDKLEMLLISLILGGALGNITDRIVHGAVTDFLFFHLPEGPSWPAFNVADSFISVSLSVLLFRIIFTGDKKNAPDTV